MQDAISSPVRGLEQQYTSATPDQKEEAKLRMGAVLDTLIQDIDNRCGNIRSHSLEDEIMAHEKISSNIIQEMKPFAKHKSFQMVIDDFIAPKLSIVKVGFDLIMEHLVKKLVTLRLYEKRISSLERENKILKTINLNEEIQFIVNEHLVNYMRKKRAAKVI